jgi:hypothetical protein
LKRAFAVVFALLHGAGNGIMTIAKGTLPLVLFGPAGYGARQGWMMMPARVSQALAPVLFGLALQRWGSMPFGCPPRWACWPLRRSWRSSRSVRAQRRPELRLHRLSQAVWGDDRHLSPVPQHVHDELGLVGVGHLQLKAAIRQMP